MAGKDTKSLLKQARDAIKDKDFKSALKICKVVLQSDKDNYNAWVFVGAAAQEVDQPDQSVAAFERAIELSPKQPLAWQGLCSFYEKNETPENIPKLVSVYRELLELSTLDKKLDILDKLISVLKKLKDREKVIKTLKLKLELMKGEETKEVYRSIFSELTGEAKLSAFEMEAQVEALQHLVDEFSEDKCLNIITNCVDVLYKAGEENHSLKLAFIIFQKHPFSCLEFISRAAMNYYIEKGTTLNGLENVSQKMNEMTSNGLPQIFEGFCCYVSGKYLQAIGKLKEGLSKMEYNVQGWYFLSKSQLKLHHYSEAEISASSAITIGMKSKLPPEWIGKFYLNLGQVLFGKQNWDGAIKALKKCSEHMEKTKEMLITFCFTLLRIGQFAKAEQMLHDLKEQYPDHDPEILQLEGYYLLLKGDLSEALQRLRLSVSLQESSFSLHLIGVVLWETKKRGDDKAFKVFVKAAESDPYFAKNFLYLGHHYYFNLNDKSKACLCYKKAFSLDSSDTEIGMSLSQVLKELKREEENMAVLKKITENANLGSCKWAWTQLGLYYLEMNNFSDAIFSLQKALRADPDSSHGWECLADAYFKRGSYESALKAYERVSEINSKATYPLYQIATIQKMRGVYTEAIEKFKNLLNTVSTYVPALIGLAETFILYAKKALDDGLFGVAKDSCQEALHILSRVSRTNTGLSCLWKLAGDACTIPYHLNEKWFPINMPTELAQDSEISESIPCDKLQLLSFGAKFFGRALLVKDSVSTLWHDLGVNYHYQSTIADNHVELSKKAFICLQKAISICPLNDAHWRALGVVALGEGLKDFAFGQHAFIKSLLLNRQDAESWTNLGILYLLKQNIELSHIAFKKAQSSEPSYSLSWIGQAIIADKVKHSETLDLFRHATTLGSHEEALVGYSKAVCEALLHTEDKNSLSYKYNIEDMDAVVRAADCSIKFIANNHNCPAMNNILGILLERQRLYNGSLTAYGRALNLLEDGNENEFFQAVRINHARILSSVGRVKEANREYLLMKANDISVICSFAFALFKDKQYEQALRLFSQAFEKSKIPADKSHIKVAMAMVAKNMKDPNSPNPLTLLFESIQISPPSVYGLLALYAEGILNEELNLLLAARKELHPYRYSQKYASSAALLWASHYHKMRGVKIGRNELLKYLHCLPANHEIWLEAATCLLQWDSEYSSLASYCSKVSVFHGGCKEEASQIFALSQMSGRKEALSAAQKAVHINPGKLTNWTTLAAACHVADLDRKHVGWMFGFVKKLAKEEKVKADLLGWLVVMEIFHHINCGNLSDASTLTNQALLLTKSFNSEVISSLQILDAVLKVFTSPSGNLQPLFLAVKNNPTSFFGWSVLSQLLLNSGNDAEAEKMLSHFVLTCKKIFPKWTAYPLLQLAILSYRALKANPEERDKWLHLGEEVSGKAVHSAPSNRAARFLQGLFALESGNNNLARRCFEKASSRSEERRKVWMETAADNISECRNLKRKTKVENEGEV